MEFIGFDVTCLNKILADPRQQAPPMQTTTQQLTTCNINTFARRRSGRAAHILNLLCVRASQQVVVELALRCKCKIDRVEKATATMSLLLKVSAQASLRPKFGQKLARCDGLGISSAIEFDKAIFCVLSFVAAGGMGSESAAM
eukprot:4460192-Amphidinium_carterae.1